MAMFLAAVWLDTPLLVDAAIKSVVLLGLTALAVAALRRSSAATKHLVWFLGTLGVLVLPLASALLPGWHFILPWPAAAQRQSAATEPLAAAARPSPSPMHEAQPEAAVSRQSAARPSVVAPAAPMPATIEPRPAIAWRTLAGRAWLAVSTLILAYVVLGMISLWRLRRRSTPLADASWLALVDGLRRQLGIGQPVNLLVSDSRTMPMTWGVHRARLLLPDDAAAWTPELARAVLLHELAHVKRHDCLTQLVAQLACALFWFNPLVWLARQGMQNEREQACDDLVLASGASAAAYAEQLLYVAGGMSLPRLAGGAIAMARPSKLKVRLTAILDTTRSRQLAGRTAACFWLAAGFCTAVFAAVHVEDLSGDSALAVVSRWAAEHGWQAQEVTTADLTGSFGPAWRNLPFHVSKEEEADTRACIELARKARSSVNGKTLFADLATRQALEEILRRRPEFFYAEFLLSTWHRDFGDPAESQRLLAAAYEHAPVILVQRFEFADGSPLVGGAVYGFTIECNRVENHYLDQIHLEFLNLRTDANGCIYLPVYDTVYRRFSASTPYGYSVDFPTLGWCQTSRKVGLLPVAIATADGGSFVPAVPASGPPVFGADLADGNSVELLAISGDGRDQPSGWWLPDGALSPRDYQVTEPYPDGWQAGPRRRFVLRFAKPLAEDAHQVLRASAPSGFVRFGTVEGEDPRTTFSMFNSFPTNPRSISLRLGVASGGGRTLGYYDPRTRTDSGDLPNGFSFSEIKELGTAATNDYRFRVLLLHPEVDEQLRLYAVDDQQQEHTTGAGSHGTGSPLPPGIVEDGFEFWGLPLDTIASFRLEARDYQWAEFDNIALAPRAAAPRRATSRPLGRWGAPRQAASWPTAARSSCWRSARY